MQSKRKIKIKSAFLGGVFNPGKLFDKLCIKCPQFRGGEQHDSHELLRHLLESVRQE